MLTEPARTEEQDSSPDALNEDGDWITTTLPVCALVGFERFAAVEKVPEWLPVIRSARVLARDKNGRPLRVTFLAKMKRAQIGYQLNYQFDEEALTVRFSTPEDATVRVEGWARFTPLGHYASMLEYQLIVESDGLPAWRDPFFECHAPSAVLYHFRDHINRLVL